MALHKQIIFVLGATRSGASAMVRMLNLLGAELGNDRTGSSAAFYQRTAFPDVGVTSINEDIFKALGSSWYDTADLPDKWWQQPRFERNKQQIREFIDSNFSSSDIAVIKDPRLCKLFPLWKDALKFSGRKIGVILITRHPDETTASLCEHAPVPRALGYLLWSLYLRDAEVSTRSLPRVVISYQDLLQDWRSVATRISERLSVSWLGLNDVAARMIDEEIKPGRKRNDAITLDLDSGLRDICLTQWKEMGRLEEYTPDTVDRVWQKLEKPLAAERSKLLQITTSRLFQLVNEQDRETRDYSQRIKDLTVSLDNTSRQHMMVSENLEELLTKIEEMEKKQVRLLQQYGEKENDLEQLKKELELLQQELQNKEREIKNLSTRLEQILSNRIVRTLLKTMNIPASA